MLSFVNMAIIIKWKQKVALDADLAREQVLNHTLNLYGNHTYSNIHMIMSKYSSNTFYEIGGRIIH